MMHGDDEDDLDEVKVTAQKIGPDLRPVTSSSPKTPLPQEELPEIVVQARRIPWWVWAGAGALIVLALVNSRKR